MVKVLLTQVESKQGKKWEHIQTHTNIYKNWPEITGHLSNVFLSRTIFFCTLNRLKYLVWAEGRKSVFHNFNLKTSCNKASAHRLKKKKWNHVVLLTTIGLKLTKNTPTIYVTVHRGRRLWGRPRGNDDRLCIPHILHYKINAVLGKSHLPCLAF